VNERTDQQLLRDYAEQRSEAAFAELVRRHVDLVYSAALRMVRDALKQIRGCSCVAPASQIRVS
jgi:hypothetical protein